MKLKKVCLVALLICTVAIGAHGGLKKSVVNAADKKLTFRVKTTSSSDAGKEDGYKKDDEVKVVLSLDDNIRPGITSFTIKLDFSKGLQFQDVVIDDTFAKDTVYHLNEYEGQDSLYINWAVLAKTIDDIPDINKSEIAVITLKIVDDSAKIYPINCRIDSDEVYKSYLTLNGVVDENVEYAIDLSSAPVKLDNVAGVGCKVIATEESKKDEKDDSKTWIYAIVGVVVGVGLSVTAYHFYKRRKSGGQA
ncbi:MAG: hypothetical protein K6F17_02260 [Lachnospiraceae bacterium]|nr:hypothetical protein [Lachnospiraceae bacterium]